MRLICFSVYKKIGGGFFGASHRFLTMPKNKYHRLLDFLRSPKGLLAILAVAAMLFIFYLRSQSQNGQNIYTVKQGNLVNTLLVNGTYTTAAQTEVNSPADGIITQLYVKDGEAVRQGTPLFHVESTATETQKAAALAGYLSAKSTVDSDNATAYSLRSTMYTKWKAFLDLADSSTYHNSDGSPNNNTRLNAEFQEAQDDWLAAEANYKNQQAVLAKDQAALTSALLAYNATQSITVNSPSTGVVVNLQKKMGDQVESVQTALAAQTQSGQTGITIPPILIVADLSNPVFTAAVDQINMPRIKIGQKVSLVFDALPDQKFDGVVENVDTVGMKTQGTTTYDIAIKVDNPSAEVRPNMTASATIETLRKDNVLTIPNSAVIEKDGQVFVRKENAANGHLTPVKPGAKGTTETEVTDGLSAGDRIVIPE